jgi:hypothetical protein
MEMLRFIASVAYRNPGMAASGMLSQRGNRPKLAGSCGSPPSAGNHVAMSPLDPKRPVASGRSRGS